MLNETKGILCALLFATLAIAGCAKSDTPTPIVELEKKYPELKKKYVYQSLIRLANFKRDPDYENLIKDVRKIILYLPPSEDSTYQITGLPSGLRSDGYEELISVRTAEAQRISLWVKESGKKSHYVALVDSSTDDVILEVDGEIHPEYIQSLVGADQSSLMNLLKGGF